MKPFIHDDFLLESESARRLYHEVAKDLPIIDYHSHLPPGEIAENARYENLYEIWLAGDHYKWRAMRAAGVSEELLTGGGAAYDKFLAWAKTLPRTLRNPLYHWSHLELKRYFDIDDLLSPATAESIWKRSQARMAEPDFRVHGLLEKFKVEVLCTTDDPVDDLAQHEAIAKGPSPTRVFPTFRPDRALKTADVKAFNLYADALSKASNIDTSLLNGFRDALKSRHDFFHHRGCRLSDHGLTQAHATFCNENDTRRIFDKLRSGVEISPEDQERFATAMMLDFGRWDAEKGWTKQLHLGALRNNRTRLFQSAGADIGCDSIHDAPQAELLGRYLDRLDQEDAAPKMIVYNVNPADNYALATMMANFNDGKIVGKMQFGSGWWHLDQKEGMEWQMNAVSNVGLFPLFVGMLTDSRSFLSFCRHEYFRRILCNLVGADVAAGRLPDEPELLETLVRDICHDNAESYFGFPK